MTADVSELLVEGAWQHRFVSANGARFHVAEAGAGPAVILLHGFPQFWWCWRHQLPALAASGYRAIAMDLRGYGASDKPPRGYDTATLAADVAGVVRAVGVSNAVIVGHDWGGWIAWAMPAYARRLTRAIAVVSAAHPLQMRRSVLGLGHSAAARRQRRALSDVLAFQAPMLPERRLATGEGVARLLTEWGGPGYPDEATVAMYRRAMQVPFVAHTSLEYFRWALRSLPRPDGRHFASALSRPLDVPVLQLHGGLDPYVLPSTAAASAQWCRGPRQEVLVPQAGHFLPEESPDAVTDALLTWLDKLPEHSHSRVPS